ncbi:Uncharacterized protein TCM_034626 [Theobroma cacao]|uniref:Uncharacterized protein n=1 Tax=Theobroma cacao TaxID=3641 RepID=A0A061FFE0_THECC|nr:Uncharacterized protein TCM_034626 [Theobroma cacao]
MERESGDWQGVMMSSASGNSSRAVFARLSLKRHPEMGPKKQELTKEKWECFFFCCFCWGSDETERDPPIWLAVAAAAAAADQLAAGHWELSSSLL